MQPVAVFNMDEVAGEGFFGADDDFVRFRADFNHVKRGVVFGYTAPDANAFALADCVMDDTIMLRENSAALVHNIAGFFGFGADFLDDFCVIAMRNEANVLAVGFLCGQQA